MRLGLAFLFAVLSTTAGLMYHFSSQAGRGHAAAVRAGAGASRVPALPVRSVIAGAPGDDAEDVVAAEPAGRSTPPGPEAEAPPKQVLYQYVDEGGSVRLVESLEQVPPAWRSRAGRIEIDAAPRRPSSSAFSTARLAGSRAREDTTEGQVWRTRRHDPEIIIYTTSWCGACRKAIAYLDEKGIDYTNKDIEEDDGAREEYLDKLRSSNRRRGVPLIDVGGELMQGFSSGRLERLLAQPG